MRKATRSPSTGGPARTGGPTRHRAGAGGGRTPLVPFGPQLPGGANRHPRRAPIPLELEADRLAELVVSRARGHPGTGAGDRSGPAIDPTLDSGTGATDQRRQTQRLEPSRFTPTTAATLSTPTSPGRPLPRSVLDILQAALGADLSRLRVHNDQPAAAVTADHRALALAAGADIYFAPGAFKPDTEAGLRLLAHETVHVLQQTGRRGADGTWRATDASGTGPPQATDDFANRIAPLGAPQRWTEVVEAHGAGSGDSPVAALAATIAIDLDHRIEPGADELAEVARQISERGLDSFSDAELAFVTDVLKAGEYWEGAAITCEGRTLFTLARSEVFQTWLMANRNQRWWNAQVSQRPELANYRNHIYGAHRIFLVRPDTNPSRVRIEALEPVVGRAPSSRPAMVVDDVTAAALDRLKQLDNTRFSLEKEISERFPGRGGTMLARTGKGRSDLLQAHWAAQSSTAGSIEARAEAWFGRVATAASEFWTTQTATLETDRQQPSSAESGSADTSSPAPVDLPTDSAPAQAVAQVAVAGVRFLDIDSETVPGPSAYRNRIRQFRQVIADQLDQMKSELSSFRPHSQGPERAQAAVWVYYRLHWLDAVVADYHENPTSESGLERALRIDDARQFNRFQVALGLRAFALAAGLGFVTEATDAIFENRAGGYTRLIIGSDWEKPNRSEAGAFSEDFPRGVSLVEPSETVAGLSISSAAVENFYLGDRLEFIASQIDSLLNQSGDDKATDGLILRELAERVATRPAPTRWSVERGYWASNEAEGRTIADVIRQHPMTEELQNKRQAELAAIGYPPSLFIFPQPRVVARPENLPTPVFVWELPNPARLVSEVANTLEATVGVWSEPLPTGDHIGVWIEWLEAANRNLTDADRARVADGFSQRVGAHIETQRTRLGVSGLPPGLLRRATNHDRAVTAERVTELLATYDGTVTGGDYEAPNRALEVIESFYRAALPAEDQVAQLVGLMATVASDIRSAFFQALLLGSVRPERRFDLITGWHGPITVATNWLEQAKNRDRLSRDFTPQLDGPALASALADLKDVKEQFETARADVQTGFGFKVVEEDGVAGLRSLSFPQTVRIGEPFGPGQAFELVEVFENFTFHPPYGQPGRVIDGVEMGGHSQARVLDPDGDPVPGSTALFRLRIGEERHIVTAGQVVVLEELNLIIEQEAMARHFQQIPENLLTLAMLPLDIAELVPGPGWLVAAARIALSVTVFLSSAEFDDIKAALTGEVLEQVDGLIADLDDILSSDAVWLFLLFGSPGQGMMDRLRGRPDRRRRQRRPRGKMGRLLTRVGRLALTVADQVDKVRDRIQQPLRSTQSFVVLHPLVAEAITMAATAVESGPELAGTVESIGDTATQLNQRFESMLAAIEEFELPAEILPVDLVISAVLSLVLDRIGTKGKIAEEILNQTGVIDSVSQEIGDALRDAGLDLVNKRWKKKMKPVVDGILNSVRRDFLDGIYDSLALVGVDGIRPPDRSITARWQPETDDEADADGGESATGAAPAFAPGAGLDHRDHEPDRLEAPGGDVIPAGPGSSLPPETRAGAENRLGRDLSHIRIHRATIGAGIDGLARGTHIVIRPGLSLDAGRGRHVLDHELGHVFQQAPNATRPDRGKPGTALRIDQGDEAGAEAVARTGVASVGGHQSDDEVAAPSLSPQLLTRILRRTADYRDLASFQNAVESTTGEGELNSRQRQAVTATHAALLEAFPAPNAPGQIRVSGVPAEVGDELRAHARTRLRAIFGDNQPSSEFVRLAQESLQDVTPRRGRRRSQSAQRRVWQLRPSDFAALVESYMLVRAGVRIELKLVADPERFLQASSRSRAFEVRITGLFLGAINRNSGLWATIIDRQLRGGDARTEERRYQAVKAVIRARGPHRSAFERGSFRLKSEILDEATQRLMATSDEIDVSRWPTPQNYTNTDRAVGEIGLRIADHRTLTASPVVDRESHHTTQFLLTEFFTNRNGRPAFGRDEPGLEVRDGHPWALHRRSGDPIQFGELYAGRGGLMPAVMIARLTHRQDGLHLDRDRPDDDPTATPSQAGTFSNWWTAQAGAVPTGMTLSNRRSRTDATESITDATKARNEQLADALENAYQRMRSHMLGRLEEGLKTKEKEHYEYVASLDPSHLEDGELADDWKLDTDPDLLTRAHQAIEANNDDKMAEFGFGGGQ